MKMMLMIPCLYLLNLLIEVKSINGRIVKTVFILSLGIVASAYIYGDSYNLIISNTTFITTVALCAYLEFKDTEQSIGMYLLIPLLWFLKDFHEFYFLMIFASVVPLRFKQMNLKYVLYPIFVSLFFAVLAWLFEQEAISSGVNNINHEVFKTFAIVTLLPLYPLNISFSLVDESEHLLYLDRMAFVIIGFVIVSTNINIDLTHISMYGIDLILIVMNASYILISVLSFERKYVVRATPYLLANTFLILVNNTDILSYDWYKLLFVLVTCASFSRQKQFIKGVKNITWLNLLVVPIFAVKAPLTMMAPKMAVVSTIASMFYLFISMVIDNQEGGGSV